MAALVNQRDLVVCVLARKRKLLADGQLDAVLRQEPADPERPLWDRVDDDARRGQRAPLLWRKCQGIVEKICRRVSPSASSVRYLRDASSLAGLVEGRAP